jgi:hypothetical protein
MASTLHVSSLRAVHARLGRNGFEGACDAGGSGHDSDEAVLNAILDRTTSLCYMM